MVYRINLLAQRLEIKESLSAPQTLNSHMPSPNPEAEVAFKPLASCFLVTPSLTVGPVKIRNLQRVCRCQEYERQQAEQEVGIFSGFGV